MQLAALIIVEDAVQHARVAGVPLIEFQARRALAAGATHVVLAVERVESGLVATIDRLRSEGVPVEVARASAEVSNAVHPDDAVLLVAAHSLLSGARLADLARSTKPTLLCVEFRDGERFELIDASTRWTGFARLDGDLVRQTASGGGEWDLASLLLRRAVQQDAKRIVMAPADAASALTRVSDIAEDTLTNRLIDGAASISDSWAARRAIMPLARVTARWSVARGLSGKTTLAAAVSAAGSVASGLAGFVVPAVLLMLLAEVALSAARVLQDATGRQTPFGRWHGRLRIAAWTICAVTTGATLTGRSDQWGCLVLALVAAAALLLDGVALPRRPRAAWEADPAALALIMLAALLAGQPILGLAIIAIYACATLAVPLVHNRHA